MGRTGRYTVVIVLVVLFAATTHGQHRELTAHGDPPDPKDVSAELKRIYEHIDANFDQHVARLQQWARIRNVSNTVDGQPGIWESARFLQQVITKELGCKAEIYAPGITEWGAPGNPVVYARCDVGAKRTIIDYVQSDSMPTWPEDEWEAPPFGGQIIAKPPFKRVLVGRATANHKGREMAEINAMISAKAVTGTLPVNIIYVADHDEERMEIGLRKFMFERPELFKGAEVLFGYGGSQTADGRGEIVGQSVGCVVFDLETSGVRRQEGPGQEPMWRHVKMLGTFFGDGPNGRELRIKGIADAVLPPSPEETEYLRREAAALGRTFESVMRQRTEVRVNMTGIWGGNMAEGYAGSITPAVVKSKIDIRFPPNVDGEDVLKKVRAHLDSHGYSDAKMKVVGIVPWSWANAENDMAQAVRRMYRQFEVPFNEPPRGNYMGLWTAYGPPYLFTRGPLNLPVSRGGLGYGSGAHYGPEYYVIEGDGEKIYGFAGAMKAYATTLYNFAGKNAASTGSAENREERK